MPLKKLRKINAYVLLSVIVVITMIVYYTSFRNGHNWGGDFAYYIAQSKSIAEGTIYKFMDDANYMYDHSAWKINPRWFPWGFPLLLSPVYYIFGMNLLAMKVYVNLFFFLFLVVIFLLFREKLSDRQALLMVIIFASNPYFYRFKDGVLSDLPFSFFSLFSIFLIQQVIINKKIFINRYVSYSVLGFFIFFSYYIRTQGIVLIPTLLICQYLNHKDNLKKFSISYLLMNRFDFIPYIVFSALLMIFNRVLPPPESSYISMLSDGININRIIYNIHYYFLLLSNSFNLPLWASKIIFVTYIITVPLMVFGIIKNIKKDYLYIIYMVFTMIVLICWPYLQGLRFVLSLLPFYVYFLLVSLSKIPVLKVISVNFNLSNIFAVLIIFFSLILIFYQRIKTDMSAPMEGPYKKESIEMLNYISENTSKDDIIIFVKPTVIYLYTGRRSIITAYYHLNDIINTEAKYIIVYNKEFPEYPGYYNALISIIHNNKKYFKSVFNNNAFELYEIVQKN